MTDTTDSAETKEGELRRAYSIALKLKNSNLDLEAIYARLEKQGISKEIAKDVIANLSSERIKSIEKNEKESESIAWIKILIGVIVFIISLLFLPGYIVVPAGLIISGILYFLLKK